MTRPFWSNRMPWKPDPLAHILYDTSHIDRPRIPNVSIKRSGSEWWRVVIFIIVFLIAAFCTKC